MVCGVLFFFFKQKTAYEMRISDWSSDVCSSDLPAGRFRNFMSYDRQWLEREGSEDSFGRGLWALGRTAELTRSHGLKLWATSLADRVKIGRASCRERVCQYV